MAGTYRRLLELIAFAAIPPMIGWFVRPHDPFALHTGFPWAILPTVVFAARYGTLWGAGCAGLTLATFALTAGAYADDRSLLVSTAIGLLVMTVLVGDMTTAFRRRALDAESRRQQLERRLDAFAIDYHVLKVSHGQLEEWLAGQRFSLRQAVQGLRGALAEGRLDATSGEGVMTLLAQSCQVHVATLHRVDRDSSLDATPTARLGEAPVLSIFDPLVQEALKTRRLVTLDPERLVKHRDRSAFLAVLPIVDSRDQLHAVLAIADMPFLAFQQENLNLLALLGLQVGNLLSRVAETTQSESARSRFLVEVDQAITMASVAEARSTLLGFVFREEPDGDLAIRLLGDELRSLDACYRDHEGGHPYTLFVLLPLVSESESERYVARVQRVIAERSERTLDELLIVRRTYSIDQRAERTGVERFLRTLDRNVTAPYPIARKSRRVVRR